MNRGDAQRHERAGHAAPDPLAAALHDLRQPLDALTIYAELLQAEPERAAELAPRLLRASQAAQALAGSLFDFVVRGAPSEAPSRQPVPLRDLLARLHDQYAPLAWRKGLQLRWRAPDGELDTDPALLARVLGNLLGNAIRYTERGGVLLAVRRRGDGLCFEVWDTGVGVPEADQARIFRPFEQGAAGVAQPGGAGLGLAITQALAARLGYSLTLRSRPGRGSVFGVLTDGSADHSCGRGAAPACGS